MVGVMAEVPRRKLRRVLKTATVITISLDESKTYKVLRFACDTPTAPYVAHGVLGALRLSYEQKGADAGAVQQQLEEDHAVHALRALKLFLTRFCARRTRVKIPRRKPKPKALAACSAKPKALAACSAGGGAGGPSSLLKHV